MSSISLKLGYKYLKSNKGGLFSFTTLLAIVGLSIGISSLIVVTSVMNGFEKELENRILGVIPHSILVSNDPINDYKFLIDEVKYNNEIIDYTNKQNSNLKNNMLKSYDLYLNSRYNVTLNQKTIERVKNFFQ